MRDILENLYNNHTIDRESLIKIIKDNDENLRNELIELADKVRTEHYGNKVYFRGLIEFSNYCKNDCYYCGIRKSNKNANRYRLTKEDILSCCENGYQLGFRTFVLQGGEDPYYTDDKIIDIIKSIKEQYSDCAITLSMGEKPYESYKKYYEAGADRYLLRHETATEEHYSKLHPENLSLKNRIDCLYQLKEIGFQVGAGFMVGSPYQIDENLADDLLFLKELNPHMVGIGPFIPHKDTEFADQPAGTVDKTLLMVALTRLLLPKALIPSTTALGTIDPLGREKGIKAGANVVMPNLSPVTVRKDYSLYDNKICTGEEAAECRVCLEKRVNNAGFVMEVTRGDYFGL